MKRTQVQREHAIERRGFQLPELHISCVAADRIDERVDTRVPRDHPGDESTHGERVGHIDLLALESRALLSECVRKTLIFGSRAKSGHYGGARANEGGADCAP